MVYFNVLICVGGWSEFNDQEILWLRNSFAKSVVQMRVEEKNLDQAHMKLVRSLSFAYLGEWKYNKP